MNLVGWPFSITLLGDVGGGGAAQMFVDLGTPMSPAVFEQMLYAVEVFCALGNAGGLGGDRIAPDRVVVELAPTKPPSAGTRGAWDFSRLAIDVRGLIVLFDALALLADDLRAISITSPGIAQQAAFGPDDLPPAWPHLPFGIEDDRTGPNVELEIELARVPTQEEHDVVLEHLGAWLDAGSTQGFRDWALAADHSFIAPTEDPRFRIQRSTVAALLHDSGALEGAYDILYNVLTKLHATVPVAVVEML